MFASVHPWLFDMFCFYLHVHLHGCMVDSSRFPLHFLSFNSACLQPPNPTNPPTLPTSTSTSTAKLRPPSSTPPCQCPLACTFRSPQQFNRQLSPFQPFQFTTPQILTSPSTSTASTLQPWSTSPRPHHVHFTLVHVCVPPLSVHSSTSLVSPPLAHLTAHSP